MLPWKLRVLTTGPAGKSPAVLCRALLVRIAVAKVPLGLQVLVAPLVLGPSPPLLSSPRLLSASLVRDWVCSPVRRRVSSLP